MEDIKDILKTYKVAETGKAVPEWQDWALKFCKKYSIPRRDYGRIMSVAKNNQDKLDYLRYVEGWLSDYPSLRGNPIRLFMWKIKQDRISREADNKRSKLIYM